MKLENCGRCGHEANLEPEYEKVVFPCPCCGNDKNEVRGGIFISTSKEDWNTDQRRIRTERINAAALEMYCRMGYDRFGFAVEDAEKFIDAQDAAAQARFAKAQDTE